MAADREVIVVSNREPCRHDLTAAGEVIVRRPASGLVTALESVLHRGVWVAHGSGSADRLIADQQGHIVIGGSQSSFLLRRVWLTPDEQQGSFYGFAHQGLWPLCHRALYAPVFRPCDWLAYETVNRRFVDAVLEEMHTEQPIVLVYGHHLALVPRLLREHRPGATVVTYWDIPWPTAEQLSVCDYRREIYAGLLGSDIVGFQTMSDGDNFLDGAEQSERWTVDRRGSAIEETRGLVLVRSYATSMDWSNRWPSQMPPVEECRRSVRGQLGIDDSAALVISIDRTQGLAERLVAFQRLLQMAASTGRRVSVLQLPAPADVGNARRSTLATRVREEIARINQRFGSRNFTPVTYVDQYLKPAEVFRCYRAADVCYVAGRDEAMNLAAKEFVAARDDEHGVLVLSQFGEAARELADALMVNPSDVDGVAAALAHALDVSEVEQQARMREMRGQMAVHHVYTWAADMLADAEAIAAEPVAAP